MCVHTCIHMHICLCLYVFVENADSCTKVFLLVHLPDLEYSVREKKQCVDRAGLKLSTKANNV